jgi:hypothetical protein
MSNWIYQMNDTHWNYHRHCTPFGCHLCSGLELATRDATRERQLILFDIASLISDCSNRLRGLFEARSFDAPDDRPRVLTAMLNALLSGVDTLARTPSELEWQQGKQDSAGNNA